MVKGKICEILGNEKPVTIGSNVLVGWDATVLCGTTIEDNVIIGAHAVVSSRLGHDSALGDCSADLFLGALSREACRDPARGGLGVREALSHQGAWPEPDGGL